MTYFDFAAATKTDQEVIKAMKPYMGGSFYNPSALYTPARKIREELDGFRTRVAGILGAKPGEIVFTAGATESINLAIGGVARKFPDSSVCISGMEHSSVTASARGFAARVIDIPPDSSGLIDQSALEKAIADDTVLISVGYVNGEIGTVQPLAQLAEVVRSVRTQRYKKGNRLPLYFHSDASQAPWYLSVDVRRLGLDMMTLNGGKMYGPKQSGLLYVAHSVELEPLIYGGGQEKGLRAGTENAAAVAGFSKALELAYKGHKAEAKRLGGLQKQLINGLVDLGGSINGSQKHRISGNVNVSFEGVDGESLVHYLDAAGILAATGSACTASDNRPSSTLVAIGLNKSKIKGSLRLTLGRTTTQKDVGKLLAELDRLLPKLRSSRI